MGDKFNLATDIPVINNRRDLAAWLKPLYIINDYIADFETYETFQHKLLNLLKACFDIRECREYPIKFKFYKTDKAVHELELRHFYINYLIWRPLVEISDSEFMTDRFILDCYKDIAKINDFVNENIIDILREYHIKSTTVNKDISDSLYYLRGISIDFALIMGLNFSIQTFIDLYDSSDEIRNIMEIKFNQTDQPHEIEEKLNNAENTLINYLINIPDNPLGKILSTGTGIKHKQLREFASNGGLKPTISGETMPKPLSHSTLIGGLSSASDIYIDGTGARKSLVMNKTVMGRAGYFAKIITLLVRDRGMSRTISDCHSPHLVTYEVKSPKHLKKLNGKYYYSEDIDDFKMINYRTDSHLIGKSVKVRSAVTCACKDGICPRCIGYTSIINNDIADGYAAFESEEVTKVVNQSILSAKHLLTTNSESIDFSPEFDKFFTLVSGEIFPIVNNPIVENINDYGIYIDPDELFKVDEMDDDSLYNTYIASGKFTIVNLVNKSEPPIEIKNLNGKEIYVNSDAIELWKKGHIIRFSMLDDDFKLFEIVINNNELTKPLYQIMDLLNKARSEDIDESYNSLSQKFLDLLIEAGIPANVIAAEIILTNLIRSEKNLYDRPDFSQEYLEPYRILTIDKAIKKHRSILIGLCYQDLKAQLLSDETFTERTASSYLDSFFQVNIPTDNIKMYDEMVREDDELAVERFLKAVEKDNRSIEEFIEDSEN